MGSSGMTQDTDTQIPVSRLVTGGLVFTTGFLAPLLIPLVADSSLDTETKIVVSGFLAVGIPELGMLLAVGILGKSGFLFLKQHLFSTVAHLVFPDQVGPWRHRVGLLMFLLPLLFGWAQPYLAYLYPASGIQQPMYAAVSDAVFVLSLFVLGGEFWEKLRNLFVR